MQDTRFELDDGLRLDANAVAGLLQELFGVEMTAAPAQCAGCGNEAEVGSLLAYVHGPGYVLRCSACKQVVLRIVEMPDSILIDARGAAYVRIRRS